jgi:hypothetical protein
MSNWTDWIDIDLAKSNQGPLNDFGIYEIRVVDSKGQPVPISRLVGVDSVGLLYVGRSGYRWQKTHRTVANRVGEFIRQQHSGGITYARARETLQKTKRFSDHCLQIRGMFLPDKEIDLAEIKVLRNYFSEHAELPPCNSAFPRAAKSGNDM